MRPSEINEKKDRLVAVTLTIIIHAVIMATLFLVATPNFNGKKIEPVKPEISTKVKPQEKA